MELQFYGANCLSINTKGLRLVIDDNLTALKAKSIIKSDDVALFTSKDHSNVTSRLVFDGPGEYEVNDISINGIAVRSHMDEQTSGQTTTMYKITGAGTNVLVTGHIHPDIKDTIIESVGTIDILIIPIGGHGYTIDAVGALRIIKAIEPKVVIPTHYAESSLNYPVPQIELEEGLKDLAMETKQKLQKYKVKPLELTGASQLIVLEKS